MRKIKGFFRFLLLLVILSGVLVIYSGHKKYEEALNSLPIEQAIDEIRSIENYTKISDVPNIYKNSVIALEDRRFYLHNGFDIVGIVRAIITDIKEKALVEGASTITQQLAKNMYFLNDRSPTRKIAEIFMATQLENTLSKDEILELYMNCIYYGSGYYNIHDASFGYFKKAPKDMNDYEATLLCGVPNAPSVYSPKVNLELCHKRQEKTIKSLISCGYINEEKGKEILLMQSN